MSAEVLDSDARAGRTELGLDGDQRQSIQQEACHSPRAYTNRGEDGCSRDNGIRMKHIFTTIEVCAATGLTEPALRHLLRRPGAPRPELHRTARVFLWTEKDLAALRTFIEGSARTSKERKPNVRD